MSWKHPKLDVFFLDSTVLMFKNLKWHQNWTRSTARGLCWNGCSVMPTCCCCCSTLLMLWIVSSTKGQNMITDAALRSHSEGKRRWAAAAVEPGLCCYIKLNRWWKASQVGGKNSCSWKNTGWKKNVQRRKYIKIASNKTLVTVSYLK